MLPYLGHDITSYLWVIPLWLTLNERQRIIKHSIEMSKHCDRMLLGWKARFDKGWCLCLGSWGDSGWGVGGARISAELCLYLGTLRFSLFPLSRSLSLPLACAPSPSFALSPCCLSDSFDHSTLWSRVPKWKRGEGRSHRKFMPKLPATILAKCTSPSWHKLQDLWKWLMGKRK